MAKRHLSIEQAAELLGITPAEMGELRNGGEIRGIPDQGTWKFDVDDVTELARTRGRRTAAAFLEAAGPAELVKPHEPADPAEAPNPTVSTLITRRPTEPAADVARMRRELLSAPSAITSRMIIDYLAQVCRVTPAEAESVVDGFWNDVVDMAHYKDGRALVIPHFGTFALCRRGDQTGLAFRSRPVESIRQGREERRGRNVSERWIGIFQKSGQRDVAQLSVKRRMAVRIAAGAGCDLRLAHRVLWELLDVVCEIFATNEKKIRWAKRGEMAPFSWGDEKWYRFRCYRRLSARLPEWAETQRTTGLGATGVTEKTHVRQTSPRPPRSRTARPRPTAETGCLTSVLVVVAILAAVIVAAL